MIKNYRRKPEIVMLKTAYTTIGSVELAIEYNDDIWIARTYANDPNHSKSWRDEYDETGNWISHTVANNPNHFESWRVKEEKTKCRPL